MTQSVVKRIAVHARNAVIFAYRLIRDYIALGAYSFYHVRVLAIRPVQVVFYRQLYFTGWESLLPVAFMSLMCGALVTTQTIRFAGSDSTFVVKAMAWLIVRELGPLIATMMIIARSCPAIASELATMKVRGEITSLRHMGISPLDYLVLPRILGASLALAVLTLVFECVAIIGGLGVSALFQNVSFANQISRFLLVVNPLEFLGSGLKGLAFGVIISSISCYHGMSIGTSFTEVPQAVIRAVTRSMIAVFLFDFLLTAPRYIN
jgi:phospholipid/cholesterol/gamma-HCH transport system permease protein